MTKFKLSMLTLALAAAGTSSVAYAQTTEAANEQAKADEQIEVIAVTGFRRSLQESQNIKMFNSSIVEAISAEDIGKLPDSSIAESIARMPGLAAQRLDGRASRVSIRGFGENEGATTFNGREQVSIGDNRGVEFDLYPSEIMSQVLVYKTPDAKLDAEGIAGVIDLRTVRPLSKEQTIQINGQYEKTGFGKLNPDGDNAGARGTFSYIDKFADDTIGFAFAATTMSSPNQEKRWNAWGYDGAQQTADWGGSVDGGSIGLSNDYRVLGGAKPFARSSVLDRDSVMAVLEYAPNDKLHVIADALYVDFVDEKILRGIEIPGVWANGHTEVVAVENGLATEGIITNEAVIRNDFETRSAELKAFGLNVEYVIDENLSIEFDASHSSVERQIWSMESYAGTGRGNNVGAKDTISYELRPGGSGAIFNPTLDYSDWSLMQLGGPLSWGNGNTVPSNAQDGFINAPEIDGELTTLKLAAEQMLADSGIIRSIDYGVSYKDREKTKRSEGYYLTLLDYPNTLVVPEKYRVGTANLDFIGMGNMIAYDSRALVNDGFYGFTSESLTLNKHLTKSWTVKERVIAPYIQANIDTEVADLALTGNVGLRYVKTDQESQGFGNYFEDGELKYVPTDIEHDFGVLLPSLNLKLALDDKQSVRFGAAKTISRPRLDEMNASVSVDYNPASTSGYYWNVSGGNPALEPKEAIGFDLSYENYFSQEGYFSVALFHKELKNWIFDGKAVLDFSGVPTPDGSAPLGTAALVSGKVNGGEGSLSGYELSVSLPLNVFSDALDGFGVVASHTGVTSDINDQNGNDYKIPGLSDKIQTFTAYYDNHGFSMRASMRKRSSFKGDIFVIGFDTEQYDMAAETIWDMQIGYDFGEAGFEKLKGLSVFLQGQNLTNEPFVSYNNGAVRDYQEYGRTYLAGFAYKF